MNYFKFLDVVDNLKDLVDKGLELFSDTDNAITSVIIQLTATIILFLAVRFLVWDKITKIIEEKEKNEQEAFDALNQAKKETQEIYEKAKIDEEKAKKEAFEIVERAKQRSYVEAEEIIKRANIDANMKLEKAKEEIDLEVKNARGQIKKEIVENAYMLAEKIINKEIDAEKHQELVNDFVKELKDNE